MMSINKLFFLACFYAGKTAVLETGALLAMMEESMAGINKLLFERTKLREDNNRSVCI